MLSAKGSMTINTTTKTYSVKSQLEKDLISITKQLERAAAMGHRLLVSAFNITACYRLQFGLRFEYARFLPKYKVIVVASSNDYSAAIAHRNSSDGAVLYIFPSGLWVPAEIETTTQEVTGFSKALTKRMDALEIKLGKI
jgi:hypothetical protein